MNLLTGTMLLVFYSVIMLWRVSIISRKSKAPLYLAPFFIWGIFANVLAAFVYYEMSFTFLWFWLDISFFVIYAMLVFVMICVLNSASTKGNK